MRLDKNSLCLPITLVIFSCYLTGILMKIPLLTYAITFILILFILNLCGLNIKGVLAIFPFLFLLFYFFYIDTYNFATIEVFGLLGISWINIVLFVTFALVYTGLFIIPYLYKWLCELGEYNPDKTWKPYINNIRIGFILFFVLIFCINSIPPVFLHVDPSANISTAAFMISLLMVPLFLISFRIFTNPSRILIQTFFVFINSRKISEVDLKRKIRDFKGNAINFLFSFIFGALILISISFFLQYYTDPKKSHIDQITNMIFPYYPKFDQYSIIFFIVLEFAILFIITYMGEKILKEYPPIIIEDSS